MSATLAMNTTTESIFVEQANSIYSSGCFIISLLFFVIFLISLASRGEGVKYFITSVVLYMLHLGLYWGTYSSFDGYFDYLGRLFLGFALAPVFLIVGVICGPALCIAMFFSSNKN